MAKADKEGQRKAPILRFKGFTDDWEQRKLSSLGKIIAGGDKDSKKLKQEGKYPVIANNLENDGIIGYYENDYKVDAPAITITARGNIGNATARFVNFTPVVRLLVLKTNLNTKFIEQSINNIKFFIESTGVPQLTVPQLSNYSIFVPNKSEQYKIGLMFNQLDSLIALYDRKLKLIKLIYKELENKVYNNDLIKQTSFTKVKLGEILKEENIKSTYEDQYPVLSSTNSGIELRNGRTNSSSNVGYKILSKNELVLSPQNLWLGNININFDFKNGLVSPSYKVFNLTNDINIIYLNSLLHHPKMMYLYKVVSVQGASVVRRNLDIEAFENLTLKLPSIEVQNKIGNLLDKNKKLIDNLKNKKEQISKIKTALLNTMFI